MDKVHFLYLDENMKREGDRYYQGVIIQVDEGLPETFDTGRPEFDLLTAFSVGRFRKGARFRPETIGGVESYLKDNGLEELPTLSEYEQGQALAKAYIHLHRMGVIPKMSDLSIYVRMELHAIVRLTEIMGMSVVEWERSVNVERDDDALGPIETYGECTVSFRPPKGSGTISFIFSQWNEDRDDLGTYTIEMLEK